MNINPFGLFRRKGITPSSGNVWRDLGFPNADELKAEADAIIEQLKRKAIRPEDV